MILDKLVTLDFTESECDWCGGELNSKRNLKCW